MTTTAAADIALALFAVFSVLGLGWRSWMQHRRTGSTGFRGISARFGSLESIAGVGVAAALTLAVVAAILQRTSMIEPLSILGMLWIQIAGIVVATAGIVAMVYAQLAMGDSWRIGVDERETTTLVRTGPFRWVRNPIYGAMLAFGFGISLVIPNLVAVAGFFLLAATIEVHVRRVEEPYLLRTHGDAYHAYAGDVGRFIPGVGLRKPPTSAH